MLCVSLEVMVVVIPDKKYLKTEEPAALSTSNISWWDQDLYFPRGILSDCFPLNIRVETARNQCLGFQGAQSKGAKAEGEWSDQAVFTSSWTACLFPRCFPCTASCISPECILFVFILFCFVMPPHLAFRASEHIFVDKVFHFIFKLRGA